MKTLIIGAGLAGLSAAYSLKDNYLIIESNDEVGGLAKSIRPIRMGGYLDEI